MNPKDLKRWIAQRQRQQNAEWLKDNLELKFFKYHEFHVFSFSLKSHISGLILVFDPFDTSPFVYLNLN